MATQRPSRPRIFEPGHPAVTVVRPGDFVLHVRELLAYLNPKP